MTNEAIDKDLAEIRAEREIQRTILRYIRGADRRDFELMASAYHDDAYEDHGAFKGGVKDFVEWVRKRHETIEQAMHFVGNCLIEVEGDKAFAETYCIIVQHERTGLKDFATASPTFKRTTMGVRYVDRFEEREGKWKITHRILVCEWIDEDLGGIDVGPLWTVAKRSREDAIYKIRGAGR
jgi:hypothetical protein